MKHIEMKMKMKPIQRKNITKLLSKGEDSREKLLKYYNAVRICKMCQKPFGIDDKKSKVTRCSKCSSKLSKFGRKKSYDAHKIVRRSN